MARKVILSLVFLLSMTYALALKTTPIVVEPVKDKHTITPRPPLSADVTYPTKITPNLIKGEVVPQGHEDYNAIIRISTQGSGCSASVIGPKAIITAAHCGGNGATASFKVKGKTYQARLTRSPLYPSQDNDISLGLVTEEVKDIKYEQIADFTANPLKNGTQILIYGYGCIQPGGGGGNDGILRKGPSEVVGFSSWDYIVKKPGGAALCYGDSGGPSFITVSNQRFQSGVNSKGNISDTSYMANLSLSASQDFLKSWAKDNSTDICGVTMDCLGIQPEKIVVESEKLGTLEFKLLPETLEPDFVRTHMENLIRYLESVGTEEEIKVLPHPEELK